LSHIVEVHAEVRDAAAARAACNRLGLPVPVHGTTKLFSGEATGLAVELPGWRYPVVCDTVTGQLRYDNYSGRWGEQKHLDAFLQSYAIEKCRIESRKRGHTLTEQPLPDGSVKLTVQIQGGTA
jgi:hypothetical protein